MRFTELLEAVGDEPLFETGFLLAGAANASDVRRQLSRWVSANRLYQLRRGLYALAPPYRKVAAHPFVVANQMVRGSYVSLQSALAHYGLIPERAPLTTSVTTRRPSHWETPLGDMTYRHVKEKLLFGYELVDVAPGQAALVATREKALLDLVYLEPDGGTAEYLEGLRLQHLESLNLERLGDQARRIDTPRVRRAAEIIAELAARESREYEAV